MRTTALLIATFAFAISQVPLASARPTHGIYVGLLGGVNFLKDTDLEILFPDDSSAQGGLVFDTGGAVGVAIGFQWDNGISIEGETTYRENGLKRQDFMGMSIDIDGDVSSFAAMVNAKYELETGGPFRPFIGAGVGAALITVDANPGTPDAFKQSDTELAFQAVAGINYELSPQLMLGVECVYFGAGSPTFNQNGVRPTFDYHSEDVFLTLSYRM